MAFHGQTGSITLAMLSINLSFLMASKLLGIYILNRADNANVVGTEGIFILQFLCRRFCFYVSLIFRDLTCYAHVLSSVLQSTDAQVFIRHRK